MRVQGKKKSGKIPLLKFPQDFIKLWGGRGVDICWGVGEGESLGDEGWNQL